MGDKEWDLLNGYRFPLGVMEMFESLIKVVVVQYYECY